MGTEIERKFLVTDERWREGAEAAEYRQGYLASAAHCTVRVRVAGEEAWLTIKGAPQGISRQEFEYPLPRAEAEQLLRLCPDGIVSKTRHRLMHAGHCWEVDEFHGDNAGLVIAEIELPHADEAFEKPPWLGEEVSADGRYANAALSRHPYRLWRKTNVESG